MRDFSFIIITDNHLDVRNEAKNSEWCNKGLVTHAREMLSIAVEDINARAVDFVVHCGDLTDNGDAVSFRAAAKVFSNLKCPIYFTPGNHDTWMPGARKLVAELFGFPDSTCYRSIEFREWRLLFLDTSYWRYKDGSVHEHIDWNEYFDTTTPDFELDWLREEMKRDSRTPTICFTHVVMASRGDYPVSRMPEGEPVKHPIGLEDYFSGSEKLQAMLKNYSCIKAVFYGHGGWHDCIIDDHVLYCQTAELVCYPNELRMVQVMADRIDTEVFPLSRGNFAELSYVPEWGNRWVQGRPEDRCYTHELT